MSHVTGSQALLNCFAVAAPGLEPLVARELGALHQHYALDVDEPEAGGVTFRTDLIGVALANLHLRVATRVLVRVGRFRASGFAELERRAGRLPWGDYLAPGRTAAFRVTSRKSRLYHQDAIGDRLAAIVARRAETARDAAGSPQEFVVRFFRDECTVSADASGELLHRRGYRLATAKAPLRETLAAAMLLGSGWDPAVPLIDPMCGSGTIPIEAALIARRVPPGIGRRFAVETWPGFDREGWEARLAAARAGVLARALAAIVGSDRDAGAIAAARANAERAGVAGDIEWRQAALSSMAPPEGTGWLVTNPPYGARIGDRLRLRDLYAQLGNVARRKLAGWNVALLSADAALERQTALAFTTRFTTENGGIPVRLVVT